MNVGEICSNNIAAVSTLDSVIDVARVMRDHDVTSVVVVDTMQEEIRPQGLITERDLVLEVLANKIDPSEVRAEDILTCELVCVRESHDLAEALKYMRFYGVKIAPVVNVNGILTGIFSIDTALATLSQEYSGLANLLSCTVVNEQKGAH